MSIIAKSTSNHPPVDAGMYVARCYEIIHLGTTHNAFYNKLIDEVRISWELPTELKVWKEGDDPMPVAISKKYTVSLHEKSTLRRDLEGWRGKTFTEAEAEGFDLMNLVGKPCMINVVHSDDGKYANVGSITPVMKGLKMPDPFNTPKLFDFDEHFDEHVDMMFPEFIVERICASTEWAAALEKLNGAPTPKQEDLNHPADPDNDLPF